MKIHVDTLVIGGGISGLAAARRLFEAEQNFILVTDRLGGRMYHSNDGSMNLGAIYITEDYKHVSRFVDRGQRLKIPEIHAVSPTGILPLLHRSNLRFMFPILRGLGILRRLKKQLSQFRIEAERIPQDKLLLRYPFIRRLAGLPAATFIKRCGLVHMDRRYVRFAIWATCFANVAEINTLFYLGVLFPLISKTYIADFSSTYERLTRGFQKKIIIDKVKTLHRTGEKSFTATTVQGKEFVVNHAIIAVPYHNAKHFYNVPKPNLEKPATVIYLKGRRRNPYEKKFILLNPEVCLTCLIWRQNNGKDLILSLSPAPDLDKYYFDFEILEQVNWKTAGIISNDNWVPMSLDPNLFLAGDYNMPGLEDSHISGICASNQIIERGRQ
jgi:hypothetical protein